MTGTDNTSAAHDNTSENNAPQGLAALKSMINQKEEQSTVSAEGGAEGEAITEKTHAEKTRSTLPPEPREKKIDAWGRAYGTGKRKSSIARVWIKPGRGAITINGRLAKDYLASAVREMVIAQPLEATKMLGSFDVVCTVKGGGLSGQAGAIRHGISRALQAYDPAWREIMKPLGLLTRDARRVERKKFGRAKARRSFQFSKR